MQKTRQAIPEAIYTPKNVPRFGNTRGHVYRSKPLSPLIPKGWQVTPLSVARFNYIELHHDFVYDVFCIVESLPKDYYNLRDAVHSQY